MGFPSALTTTQLNTIRMGEFYTDFYMLIWDAPIIFQAQINQSSFGTSFAQITFDNVTVGAFTDIKSDFKVYISATAGKAGLLTATHAFRVRADGSYVVATATVLNINETSAALVDDTYIMIVKDVPIDAKVPRTISGTTPATNSYNRDYAITFRRLLPTVYNLASYYVGVLDSDGIFDLPLAPLELTPDNDSSSISTWLWDIDGLAFEVGSSATQDITARATTAGKYMPRVTFTDNLGNKGYFTFKLWVVPADRSSIVNLSFDAPSISGDTVNGWMCSINANITDKRSALTRIDQLPDQSDCAIWFDSNLPTITSEIVFAGRFQKQTVANQFDQTGNTLLNTSFDIEGMAAQAHRAISRRMAFRDDSTPTVFGEIEDLTPWRAVSYFLTEHTTLPNVAALQYDPNDETFRFPRFGSSDSGALSSVVDLLFTVNGMAMFSPDGEIELQRKAWMLPDSGRNNLAVIASFTTQDMMADAAGGLLFSVVRAYPETVGREVGGGAYYTTATGDIQVLRALTPAVAQSEGQELATVNRQVLLANSTLTAAETELGQRTADDRAARQPQTILTVTMPASYVQVVIPHEAKWYKWTIAETDNNAGESYSTSDRWTCQSVSVGYNPRFGFPTLTAVFKLETQGTGFQTIVATPPAGNVKFFNPVTPVMPTYASFPESEDLYVPDPASIVGSDIPPFSSDDIEKAVVPHDPFISGGGTGGVNKWGERMGPRSKELIVWDGSTLWSVKNAFTVPSFNDVTPAITGSLTHAQFSRQAPTVWALSNDGDDSQLWRANPFPGTWKNVDFPAQTFHMIAGTGHVDSLYIYDRGGGASGDKDDFSINAQGWTAQNWGVYLAASYWLHTTETEGFTLARAVTIRHIFATTTITSIEIESDYIFGFFENGASAALQVKVYDAELNPTTVIRINGEDITDGHRFDRWIGREEGIGRITVEMFSHRTTGAEPASGSVHILSITTNADYAATKYSTDDGVSFEDNVVIGVSLTAGTESGIASIPAAEVDRVVVAGEDVIRTADDGGEYDDATEGATAGTYALALAGLSSDETDYVYAPAAALAGGTLFTIISSAKTDVSPDDGGGAGVIVSALALGVDSRSPERLFGLFDFSGTTKLAYSADSGANWQFNTQVTNDAVGLAIKARSGLSEVYVVDAVSLWVGRWSGDATDTLELEEKSTPGTALIGVDVL